MSRVIDQYQRACQSLAGGVCSSTRLNRAVEEQTPPANDWQAR